MGFIVFVSVCMTADADIAIVQRNRGPPQCARKLFFSSLLCCRCR